MSTPSTARPEPTLHERLHSIVERTTRLLERSTALLERAVVAAEIADTPLPAKDLVVIVTCFKRIVEIARIIQVIAPPPVEPKGYKCPLSAEEIRAIEEILNDERE